ncbi:MAG: DUF4124 domain-containing protein [Acidovorax sp.]|nr:DUF4124 domain-containing protein [Acidovorax sp.]
MSQSKWACVAVLLSLALCAPAWGISKCTGADGKVTYQDVPCAAAIPKTETVKIWSNQNSSHAEPSSRSVQPNFDLVAPAAGASLFNIYRRWADAEKLAMATSRIALAKPVADLQALQREVESAQVAACMDDAKKSLTKLISKNVEVMINFMQKEQLSGMVYQFVDRAIMIKSFEQDMTTAKCA